MRRELGSCWSLSTVGSCVMPPWSARGPAYLSQACACWTSPVRRSRWPGFGYRRIVRSYGSVGCKSPPGPTGVNFFWSLITYASQRWKNYENLSDKHFRRGQTAKEFWSQLIEGVGHAKGTLKRVRLVECGKRCLLPLYHLLAQIDFDRFARVINSFFKSDAEARAEGILISINLFYEHLHIATDCYIHTRGFESR